MVGLAYGGIIPATIAYDQFTQLAFTATVFSTLLAVYLYASSLWSSRDGGRFLTSETQLAAHGHTGNGLYDFFIGRTLNPRIGTLDLKYFCELRPGLIAWLLINLSMAAKQYEKHGEITASIVLVILFQSYYVYDALTSEVGNTDATGSDNGNKNGKNGCKDSVTNAAHPGLLAARRSLLYVCLGRVCVCVDFSVRF